MFLSLRRQKPIRGLCGRRGGGGIERKRSRCHMDPVDICTKSHTGQSKCANWSLNNYEGQEQRYQSSNQVQVQPSLGPTHPPEKVIRDPTSHQVNEWPAWVCAKAIRCPISLNKGVFFFSIASREALWAAPGLFGCN
jgi:hypothetical protein